MLATSEDTLRQFISCSIPRFYTQSSAIYYAAYSVYRYLEECLIARDRWVSTRILHLHFLQGVLSKQTYIQRVLDALRYVHSCNIKCVFRARDSISSMLEECWLRMQSFPQLEQDGQYIERIRHLPPSEQGVSFLGFIEQFFKCRYLRDWN